MDAKDDNMTDKSELEWRVTSIKILPSNGEFEAVAREFDGDIKTGNQLKVSGKSLTRLIKYLEPTGATNL